MIHCYTRHCYRTRDNARFTETLEITGEEIATRHNPSRGDRLAFLELVNRWNSQGAQNSDYFYCYVAGESRHI